jgi:arylsulfatase A-like enzyme
MYEKQSMTHTALTCKGMLITLMGLLALAALGCSLRAAAQAPRIDSPLNIVVIMADDLDVGSTETAVANHFMPNLKQYLIDLGTIFSESFVTESLCCPSRSTFLTGQYAHNHGVLRNGGAVGGFDKLDHDSTFAVWLAAGGYRTGHVGKYLNGYTLEHQVPPGWEEWYGLVDPTTYCMYDYTISHNGSPQTYGHSAADYQTDVLAGLAETFILNSNPRPFFLSIAPLAPHRESHCNPASIRPAPRHEGTVQLRLPRPPSYNEPDMSDKPTWMQQLPRRDPVALTKLYNQRIAALRAVDDLIGRVINALQTVGKLENTVLLFTSDNGYLLGLHRWESKILVYEESIRVPLVIRVPGLPGPKRVAQLALNNDLAPTIMALAGVSATRAMDGRSLLPLLDGSATTWRKRFLVEVPPTTMDPANDLDHAGEGADMRVSAFLAVRTGLAEKPELANLLYSETMNEAGVTDREFYDLHATQDPYQIESLHNDSSPARVWQQQQLKQALDALKSCGQGSSQRTCQSLEE